jgi:1-acyl-sn-glycerol-3-phosphate acyltransferase
MALPGREVKGEGGLYMPQSRALTYTDPASRAALPPAAMFLPAPSPEVLERLERLDVQFDVAGVDAYGTHRETLARALTLLGWFHRHYFQMTISGQQSVPLDGRVMLVGNHAGGYSIDAFMMLSSCFFELQRPRLAHAMADRFVARLPFLADLATKLGQLTGLPEHGERLLNDERMLLVFPEGARGTAKLYSERHSLVRFGTGFMRLALKTRTPLVPFAFLGAGEALPTFANFEGLGKLLGLPYLPLTPYLINIPLPVRLHIRFGEPMVFEGTGDETDREIEAKVELVREAIARLMAEARVEQEQQR